MGYYFEDRNIEEAMLKSCLLFNNKNIKDKRNSLFQKYLLSIIINGATKRDSIIQYIKSRHKRVSIDDSKIDSAISELNKKNIIEINGDEIFLSPVLQEEAKNGVDNIIRRLDALVDEMFERVKTDFCKPISNKEQVKLNIKGCINYYYAVSGLSFFDLDNKKDIEELGKIEQIAGQKLKAEEKEVLTNLIIYVVGSVINNPSKEQNDVLENLAQAYITTQVMGIDPLLSNFKTSIISAKEFILDTDVVLYAITNNALYSRQYRLMIEHLILCGCKVYLPSEVIREVYNHAEAAKSRYHFVSSLMDNNEDWVRNELKNIFVEDYYITKQQAKGYNVNWDTYIGNFYNSQYGLNFTLSQIRERLGDKIVYNRMPDTNDLDEKIYEELVAATLDETYKTEKAIHREDEKNREIAKTDAKLYLTTWNLNVSDKKRIGKSDMSSAYLLGERYYVLTDSVRVHYCAKKMGIEANVLCKPLALMAYLSEIGVIAKDELKIISLFDNPFLLHTSRMVWDDVQVLINNGIDLKGKNIITLQYDLQTEIRDMLSIDTDKDYIDIYSRVSQKGYSYEPYVMEIVEDVKEKDNKIEDLSQELSNVKEQLLRTQKELARKNYENRVVNKTLGKHNKRK